MSQINPNNIDGSYPVAGQDNNSQGFRDNFTNTKVNFQTAKEEISDLQDKVLLRQPLTGSNVALSVSNDLGGTGPIVGALIKNFGTNRINIGPSSGAVSVNYSTGHYQTLSTTGSISLSFTNWPAAGTYGYIKLQINVTNVAHTVSLPAAVTLGTAGIQGLSAGTITFGATGTYEFAFGTYDSGTTITIFDLNRALTNFSAADLQVDDITATGNIVAGFGGVGFISATGNVITGQGLVASGNVFGANFSAFGTVVASGNVQGGNLVTTGSADVAGNVSAANVNAFVRPSVGTGTRAPVRFTAGTNVLTPASGSFEYDGVVFYATPTNNNRGVLSNEYVLALTSNYVANNSASPQKVFNNPTNGTIELDGNTTYMMEGVYYITRTLGTNSHTLSTLFAVGGSVSSITYQVDATSSNGNVLTPVNRIYSTSITATAVTAASTTATETITVHLRGIVRTNAAGSFTPQIQYSSAPGGAPTILANSYFRMRPIGNGTVASVGNWS